MDKENQTAKSQMTAPQADDMIFRAERSAEISYEIKDSRTKDLVFELFQKLRAIAVQGDDELRELWLSVPRGSIEDFGDYEDYLEAGEAESREEFEEIWLSEYPEPQKWYRLSATVYRNAVRGNIHSVFINDKPVLQILPEQQSQPESRGQPEPQEQCEPQERCLYDNSGLARWLLSAAQEAIMSVKSGNYNEFVNKNLPYRKRFGKISREDMWRIFPEAKVEHLKNIGSDEVARFADLMKKQQAESEAHTSVSESLSVSVSVSVPVLRLPQMTGALFFDACRLGYEANNYEANKYKANNYTANKCESAEELTPKEMYQAYADGRDEGLTDLDELSAEAFEKWYHDRTRYGGHPWEVCRGGNSTHISLYVCHDEKGWWYRLAGSSFCRSVETVKFYLALADHGLPVYLEKGMKIAAMLTGEDYIGIVPEGIIPRYCASLFPEEETTGRKMIDFMNLPHERSEQVEKAASWYPLQEVRLT